MRVYVARAIMTNATPALIAAWNDLRYGFFGPVTVSTTPEVKSVLPTTLPRPGKCLAVVATPACFMPRMNAAPWAPLVCGVWPNSRCSAPIGAFELAVALGTTSITGARSRLTPAERSSRPQAAACRCSSVVDSCPWARAGGISAKPGPWSSCTWPPSWLAAMKNRTPAVVAEDASAWMACVACRSAATPAVLVPSNSSEPK